MGVNHDDSLCSLRAVRWNISYVNCKYVYYGHLTHRSGECKTCVAAELFNDRIVEPGNKPLNKSTYLSVNLHNQNLSTYKPGISSKAEAERTPFNDKVLWLLGFLMPLR